MEIAKLNTAKDCHCFIFAFAMSLLPQKQAQQPSATRRGTKLVLNANKQLYNNENSAMVYKALNSKFSTRVLDLVPIFF